MPGEFERLAYELALRGLDKQEQVLSEVRARTGILVAAAAVAVSFLGSDAFAAETPMAPAVLTLVSFLVSVGASIYVLVPKKNLTFSPDGTRIYEELYPYRDRLPEVYRRLTYELVRFWVRNDRVLARLLRAFRASAIALGAEVVLLVVLLGGTLT